MITKLVRLSLFLAIIAAMAASASSKQITATTEDGKRVLLNSDGTWSYREQDKRISNSAASYTRPQSSKKLIKTINGHFSIWIDESKWSQNKTDDPNRYEFQHLRGDAGAIVISERIGMTLDSLKAMVMENAKKAARDAEIIFEETRRVNGVDILCLKIKGTINGIFFTYFGYYYAGEDGTLQVITYTGKNLFEDYNNDFLDFLNGLEISR